MLQGREIVYVAGSWHSENKTSAHHIAEILARHNRVLYVEASGQRAMRASRRDLGKAARILAAAWGGPARVSDSLHVIAPIVLPLRGVLGLQSLNRVLLGSRVRRAVRAVGFERPLVWITLPHFSAVIDAVPSSGVVYYCVDEYAAMPGADPETARHHEAYVLERADVVLAVSEELMEKKRLHHPHTYFSPHGVDFDHFVTASQDETQVPDDISRIRGPIVGFFGFLAEWVDFELLRHIATSLPDVALLLIGYSNRDVSRLQGLPNVHLLGQRSYALLPGYLKAMDVCIVPYEVNEQTVSANPLKLREYLAGGKPVVSVAVREVQRYQDLVCVAGNYDEFVDGIRLALATDVQALREGRIAAMRKESWEARVTAICERVEAHIKPWSRT